MPRLVLLPPVIPNRDPRKVIEVENWMNKKWTYRVKYDQFSKRWEVIPF